MNTPNETHAKRHDRYTWTPAPEWEYLPGFVESGVTYESHEFWIEWTHSKWDTVARPDARLWMRNGAGVYSIDIGHHTARPLRSLLAADLRADAFHICWAAFEVPRAAASNATTMERQRIFTAHAEGRLKKRKMPGRNAHKVWVEESAPEYA